MSTLKIIPPTTISLITTFKCTAACDNCCFGCNQKGGESMTLSDMKRYVDMCLDVYGDSIKLLVLTGGECMINDKNVYAILKYATEKGLLTRIVTNGFWGASMDKSREVMSKLVLNGLKEINLSTGDDHVKWIPVNNIIYIALSAVELGLVPLINVETHDDCKIAELKWIKENENFYDHILNGKITIEKGLWMPFNPKSLDKISYNIDQNCRRYGRCTNIFSIIPINPYGEILACCGLISERVSFLRLGNLSKTPLKEIYERSFDDILKIWLYLDGPEKILSYIYKIDNRKDIVHGGYHICDYCRRIFNNISNLQILKSNYTKFATDVLLRYKFLTSKLS